MNKYGYSVHHVTLGDILHLKTGVSYLENNTLVMIPEMIEFEDFKSFNKIVVPPEEAYAANCIWINGTVLVPAGYPVTKQKIEVADYDIIELEMTEFKKLDGGLSCLSLRF
ncbi:MAG: hypothetical protein U5K71_09285 [Gracilimonas sp.]|nr:hypothetical protein [Gracilimonas sp.]